MIHVRGRTTPPIQLFPQLRTMTHSGRRTLNISGTVVVIDTFSYDDLLRWFAKSVVLARIVHEPAVIMHQLVNVFPTFERIVLELVRITVNVPLTFDLVMLLALA